MVSNQNPDQNPNPAPAQNPILGNLGKNVFNNHTRQQLKDN